MGAVWRFVRKFWWAFLGGFAFALGTAITVLTRPSDNEREQSGERQRMMTFRQRAAQQVEKVRLEGDIEKARVQARADCRREELDEIQSIGKNDPAEGRRRLAAWLTRNL